MFHLDRQHHVREVVADRNPIAVGGLDPRNSQRNQSECSQKGHRPVHPSLLKTEKVSKPRAPASSQFEAQELSSDQSPVKSRTPVLRPGKRRDSQLPAPSDPCFAGQLPIHPSLDREKRIPRLADPLRLEHSWMQVRFPAIPR